MAEGGGTSWLSEGEPFAREAAMVSAFTRNGGANQDWHREGAAIVVSNGIPVD